MPNVKGTVLKPCTYKYQRYNPGDEITMKAEHAGVYEKNDLVKFDREAEKKVEAALDKQEKNRNAGPGKR
jgi:hypothetical protein